ncbi:sialoadhesin-like isoform X2 [Megalobrama amblycephala]|uniref:sialoadhesin-like isoform X2 n=1 Tax=Megalobrama amblycephala TaxID=75352 RepID=UPI002013C96E|nr:sialoadhesin-like isoform X2 [Megalobrama amblycephala]
MVSSLIKSLPLIVVIMTAGVDGQQDWGVNYSPSYVCALKGTKVKISYPEERGGIQCLSEDKDTHSITLTKVTEADKHVYYCRFTTNIDGGNWTGIPGVQLDVTDLQVETQQRVKEGDSVTLTCKSSCSLTEQTTFIWYRNTQRFTEGIVKENQLHLWSVSRSDAGNYQCEIRGHEHLLSPAVYLHVDWVYGQRYQGVNYSPSYVCALKGSTVKISCTLTYPQSYKIKTVMWTKTVTDGESPDLCSDPEKRGGIECLSNDKDTSSITLTNVREADKHVYYCRFTDYWNKRWTVIPGAWLDVTDLQVETQQRVKEGDSVTLTCKSSCSLTEQTTFIWYRNTQRFTEGIVKENQLHLQSVSRSDTGNYRCAVRGNEHLISPPVHLDVEWVDGLWDPGVNYSPSYVCALKGSTVKISCTLKYPQYHKLIKGFWTKPVGESPDLCSDPEKRGRVQCLSEDKDTHSITLTNVTEADKHVYYCRFTYKWDKRWTVIPGAWLDVTDLQVETQQRVKEGDSVTLTCKSSCSLTEQTTFIWFRNTQRLTDRTVNQFQLKSVSRSDEGNYQCEIRRNNHLISPAVHLHVEYPPKSVSVSISPSGEIVSGDSVTLNCSSDSNPPALNFSWFKENETSAVGSGQSFSISSFNSSFSGRFYCEAQNKYGSQRSASVSLTVKGVQRAALHTVSGIVAGCGGLIFIIIIIIIVFIKKKRRDGGAEVIRQNQEDRSDRSAETALTNDVPLYSLVSANQRDDLYANIKPKKPERSGRKQAETDSGDVGEVQYASVHHFKNKDMKKTEENDCQTIETHHPSEANRSEDIIYSSVK